MAGGLQGLASLLEREREAAIAADTEALVALQADKENLLRTLDAAKVPRADAQALQDMARANIVLMRHLSNVLRGLLQIDDVAYTATGGRQSTAPNPTQFRGRV